MDTQITTRSTLLDPIRLDWTIAELIEWLGEDDVRQHDDALRDPLALIEAELTGSSWAAIPSTVALIRSIAGAVRAAPALGTIGIGSLMPSSHGEQSDLAPHGGHGRARSAQPA